MIHDAQCAFQLRAVPGIPWHQHRSSLALQPVDCPGWPFGSVVDLLCTIKAGQNMDVHMRSARLQDLPGISPMFVVVHCSAMLCYGSYIYIDYTYLHVDSMPAFVRYLGHLSIAMCSGLLLPREGQVCWDARPCAQMAGQWSRGTLQHSESLCWYQCPWFKTRIKIPQQKRNRAWSLDGDLSSEPPHDRL